MTWVTVGTAAAIGAGVGGASAIATGAEGDEILKRALIGGAAGAVTGGAGATLGGATSAGTTLGTELGTQAATELGTQAAAELGAQTATELGTQAATEGAKEGILQAGVGGAENFVPGAGGITPAAPLPTAGSTLPIQNVGGAENFVPPDSGLAARPSPVGPESMGGDFIGPGGAQNITAGTTPPPAEPNAFLQGAKDVGTWMDSNPIKTGAGAYIGLQSIGAFDQEGAEPPEKKTFNSPYRLSADFQGGPYSDPNPYKPDYSNYASGGITQVNPGPVQQMSQNMMGGQSNMYPQSQMVNTNFATPTQMPASAEVISADYGAKTDPYTGVMMAAGGIASYSAGEEVEDPDTMRPSRRYRGDLTGTLNKYNTMISGKKSNKLPSGRSDPYTGETGIARDDDIDTRLQNADVAAITRLKKTGKRANYGLAAMPRTTQAGNIKLPTQQAAGGGIMQANLGGYAAGGNPRLLKGPGDGMSDNIPATINGKQPARLADGEFVVPADVVSHLGNGSTEAGAKHLHKMMDDIRRDRTGRKKQAPAVKAKKYIPKAK
jgi:hypothetical protein